MASELDGGWEVYKILKFSYGGGGGAEGEGPIIQFTKNINKKPQKKQQQKTKLHDRQISIYRKYLGYKTSRTDK